MWWKNRFLISYFIKIMGNLVCRWFKSIFTFRLSIIEIPKIGTRPYVLKISLSQQRRTQCVFGPKILKINILMIFNQLYDYRVHTQAPPHVTPHFSRKIRDRHFGWPWSPFWLTVIIFMITWQGGTHAWRRAGLRRPTTSGLNCGRRTSPRRVLYSHHVYLIWSGLSFKSEMMKNSVFWNLLSDTPKR